MKTGLYILIIIIASTLFTFWATDSFAQIQYVPLTPLPGDNPGEPITVTQYLPRVFTLLVGLAGVLAVLMIVIGGVQYLSTDAIGGKNEAKERITNAIMGLLLAIGAFIILNTINPNALTFDLGRLGYQAPPNVQTPTTTNPPVTATMCIFATSCQGSACSSQCPIGTAFPSDSSERTTLLNRNNISIVGSNFQNPICTVTGQPGCTTVYGLGSAVNGLLGLSSACSSCNIVVTGGTEFWRHQTHGFGAGRVDIRYRAGDTLDDFIRTNGTYLGGANNCYPGQPAWRLNLSMTSSGVYVLENNSHWHICY